MILNTLKILKKLTLKPPVEENTQEMYSGNTVAKSIQVSKFIKYLYFGLGK